MSNPDELVAQKSPGIFSFLGGSNLSKYEDASDLLTQAGNLYKLQRRSVDAGRAFEQAADCQLKAESPDEAANTLVEAFKSYKLESPEQASNCLEKAINMFVQRGQFRRSANFKTDLGELYENELHDIKKSIQSYEDASEWYKGDSATALANKCALKAADLYCDDSIKEYTKAATTYERVAQESLNNSLAKWSLKEYFLKAILCRLADGNDYSSANAVLQRFTQWDPSFQSTKEFEFSNKLIEAVKNGNSDEIALAAKNFDKFSRLDGMKVRILNTIKNNVVSAPDEIDEDFT
ncbi:vesicular-fusion protein S17 [Pichia californica]|uniref:Vesicular-fusion protein S17 n=1 Tax=Pichia californica TaxID=460514 RepID=A0A9P6WGU7_9ASCO|nr:vesicular-fusion protein S17 [[Candida] californica]